MLRTLLLNLLVAVAYCVSGRLGLLLAIPPGYATAVWPASGIALACVLLWGYRVTPGVLLGSFMVNIWTPLNAVKLLALLHSGDMGEALGLVFHSATVPLVVAGGAALQALLGAVLINVLVGYSNLLAQELAVVRILILGGPAACLVSCSIGVAALWNNGQLPSESLLFNWWTWWVGDSMGVLVFTPLILVWSVRPYAVWIQRQLAATLPLVMLFALVVWLFITASAREHARVEQQLDTLAERFHDEVGHDIEQAADMLYDQTAFFGASHEVEHVEFDYFAGRLLKRMPKARGMAFNRHLTAAERPAYEALVQAEGNPGFTLREIAPDGSLTPARQRQDYIVIDYMLPHEGNESARGVDVTSEPARSEALLQAAIQQKAIATAPLKLVQDQDAIPSVVVYNPVYRPGAPLTTDADRQRNVLGYAAMALHIGDLLARGVEIARQQNCQIWVFDDGMAPGGKAIYSSTPGPLAEMGKLMLGRTVRVGMHGRTWRAELRVPAEAALARPSWQIWALLAAGMLFTGLVGTFLLVVIGRQSKVEELADRRTAELQRANSDLRREAQRSEKLEMEAQRRARELESSNHELEQFAYVASHDLQAPLRSIASFAQLLQQRYGDKLDQDAAEFIGYIRSGVGRMDAMINDILRLSRLSPEKMQLAPVNTQQLVRRACNLLASEIAASGAEVRYENLPEVVADAGMLTQLFQNLLANSLKFQAKGNKPRISVDAQQHGSEWTFAVRDNGIGIKPQFLAQVFDMFRRLHPQEEYEGSGIGLTVCRKIVQLHRGRIWAESAPDRGTAFLFTLPAPQPRGA